jgi:hypothetical protein
LYFTVNPVHPKNLRVGKMSETAKSNQLSQDVATIGPLFGEAFEFFL